MNETDLHVTIIGAGLAGSEAALVCARMGIKVTLYEMRPSTMTPAHQSGKAAELVCSNSLRSKALPSGPGLLKQELQKCNSPLLREAQHHAVAAGSALAVNRSRFSDAIDTQLNDHPRIERVEKECTSLDGMPSPVILASGPLTSHALSGWLQSRLGDAHFYFYDAIAPIVEGDSIDMNTAFCASRRMPDATDYVNCPFDHSQFERFYRALTEADTVRAHSFEDHKYFESCLPIEVIARRGKQALAFGPMRPIGLHNPHTNSRPYAVCQLRREDHGGYAFNLVGCQTRLTIGSQKKVFHLIPGLEHAHFLRYGSIHRNTYINSPRHLRPTMNLKHIPGIYIAGQLCGNEGYTESIATGHLTALFVHAALRHTQLRPPPPETALGALHRHIVDSSDTTFSPSNVHFGLFPPIAPPPGKKKWPKKEKKTRICTRARDVFDLWLSSHNELICREK